MKKLFLLSFFLPSLSFAAGPVFRHKEPEKQLEFENVYRDIRKVPRVSSNTLPSGSTQYIQNGDTLQTGAVFNVASGTVQGQFRVYALSGNSNSRIENASASPSWLTIKNAGNGSLGFELGAENSTGGGGGRYGTTANAFVMVTFTTNPIILMTNGVEAFRISGAGEITQPLQPSFLVLSNANALNVTGDGTPYTFPSDTLTTEIFDQGGDITASTFTAPVTGKYQFCGHGFTFGMTTVTHTFMAIRIVTSNRTYYFQPIANIPSAVTDYGFNFCANADMDINDTARISVTVGGSSKTVDFAGSSSGDASFSGRLLE